MLLMTTMMIITVTLIGGGGAAQGVYEGFAWDGHGASQSWQTARVAASRRVGRGVRQSTVAALTPGWHAPQLAAPGMQMGAPGLHGRRRRGW